MIPHLGHVGHVGSRAKRARFSNPGRRAALDLLASSFCIPEPREAVSRHLESRKSNSNEICCHSSNNNALLPCALLLCSCCSRPSWLEGCLDSWAAPKSASPAPDRLETSGTVTSHLGHVTHLGRSGPDFRTRGLEQLQTRWLAHSASQSLEKQFLGI